MPVLVGPAEMVTEQVVEKARTFGEGVAQFLVEGLLVVGQFRPGLNDCTSILSNSDRS